MRVVESSDRELEFDGMADEGVEVGHLIAVRWCQEVVSSALRERKRRTYC